MTLQVRPRNDQDAIQVRLRNDQDEAPGEAASLLEASLYSVEPSTKENHWFAYRKSKHAMHPVRQKRDVDMTEGR